MTNLEISWLLYEIADLLEIKGDNPFKVRAYRRGARAIELLPSDVKEAYADGRLQEVEGLGTALIGKIGEWIETGTIEYLEKLRQEIPAGVREMTNLPGVGPKLAGRFYRELGIASVDKLWKAAKKKQLRKLKGMGTKTEWQVLRGIQAYQKQGRETLLGIARPVASELMSALGQVDGVEKIQLAGSVRRWRETVNDIDIVAGTSAPTKLIDIFCRLPAVSKVLEKDDMTAAVRLRNGLQAELIAVPPEKFYPALVDCTGSKKHVAGLNQLARENGWELGRFGLKGIEVGSEEELYNLLDLPFIPPELRESGEEISAARKGQLPKLIEAADIRADLHLHTRWSDGVNTIEEMARHARENGLDYIAICDHTRSLSVANGLSIERLQAQIDEIAKVNRKFSDFTVLAGAEVDILADGKLDFPDEVLEKLDFVVASIHTGFRQKGEQLTARILAALENPYVDVIAHPTGRLIGRRDAYDVDLETIIEVASRKGKALEINASPDRLDLSDVWARRAKEAGVKLAINTDAHSIQQLEYMALGLGTARRGWLEREDVLNSFTVDELKEWKATRNG